MKAFDRSKPKPITSLLCHFCIASIFLVNSPLLMAGQIKAKVNVIIDKLPLDKQEKMQNFHIALREYI